ncbi:MAG: DUF4159 domain-containing protein [Nanoarchaeota archaeon]|nr:DUF4159 domain-containing protein [Nanoarchaeota archaeon]
MDRRNFLINAGLASTGLLASLSQAYGQENDSSIDIYRNLKTRTDIEKQIKKLQRKNMLDSKGFVVQDQSNKQNIKGFVYIPSIWSEQLKIPDLDEIVRGYIRTSTNLARLNIGLVESVNKYTNIIAKSDPALYLSSQKLKKYPFIYIATDKQFELTKTEKDNFENYLRNGGFALLESLTPELDYSSAEASLKQMIKDTLKKDVRFLPIPNSHDLYHCFFDFNDGPPQGTENTAMSTNISGLNSPGQAQITTMSKPRPYLEGIFLEDRLVLVYSGKGYGRKLTEISANEPQQKMAVNFVTYALTQKGRIAQK